MKKKVLNEKKKKVVPKLRQEVKSKVDIISSDDIKSYYTWKFQDLTAKFIIQFLHRTRKNIILYYTNSLKYKSRHKGINQL